MIGKFNGMAMNISLFPIIISSAMSTILTPNISRYFYNKDYYSAEERITNVLEISFIIGVITTIICLAIPNTLASVFYKEMILGNT